MDSVDVKLLEEDGWKALSTGGMVALGFYDRILAENPVMVLPGGLVLEDRKSILDTMGGPPWDWFRLENDRVITLHEGCVALYYQVHAQRQGEEIYTAWITSIYTREKETWKLALHQHTPV